MLVVIYSYPRWIAGFQMQTRNWEAQRDATRARPDWHHCNACRPFDATGKDRQVSEQPVAYHHINILQRKDDTGYRPHGYDTEIRYGDTQQVWTRLYESVRLFYHVQTARLESTANSSLFFSRYHGNDFVSIRCGVICV
jgi:hypothetical protein